jgi:GMP synthase-like glutamine amidotransferase
MSVGIVDMYGSVNKCRHLIQAIREITGDEPNVIEGYNIPNNKMIYDYIKASPQKFWIFSGSAHNVTDINAMHVPLRVTALHHKKIMMICYSMESLLFQLNLAVQTRYIKKTETFNLRPNIISPLFKDIKLPLIAYRNHIRYFTKNQIVSPVTLLASYNGEAMVALYKNTTLVQFHPEKSDDGKKMLANWLTSALAISKITS